MRIGRLRILFASVFGVTSVGARGGCGPAPCHMVPAQTAYEDLRLDDPAYKVLTATPDGAPLSSDDCNHFCHGESGTPVLGCRRADGDAGPRVECQYGEYQRCEGAGRRTSGLYERSVRRGDHASSLGLYFGRMAYLEAASVLSFRRLRVELRSHGAPRRLLRAASRAASDEVRHARTMTRLAQRHGVRPATPALAASRPRSLAVLAIENAAEGCVGETYGALVAAFQSRHAASPSLRATFRRIARDELRHAELAWDLARWLRQRLSSEDKRALDDAISKALADSAHDDGCDAQLRATLGLPDAHASSMLKSGLAAALGRA